MKLFMRGKMKKNVLIIPAILFIISGCTSTKIASVKAPDHGSYSRLLVFADFTDIGTRQAYERQIIEALKESDVTGLSSIELFSPLKEYSDSAVDVIGLKAGYEAIIRITSNGMSTTRHGTAYNNWFGGVTTETHEEISGVYTIVTVTDVQNKEKVYQANVSTSISMGDFSSGGVRSFAYSLTDDLKASKFLKSNKGITLEDNKPNPIFTVLAIVGVIAAVVFLASHVAVN